MSNLGNPTSQSFSVIRSSGRMSNTGYHANNKPNWWARFDGSDGEVKWLEISQTRGDSKLVCTVDVPPGTTVYIGAGKGKFKTIRETVITTET